MQTPRQTIPVQALLQPPLIGVGGALDMSISPEKLNQSLGAFPPPPVIDVRRSAAFEMADRLLQGAIRRDPDQVDDWAGALEIGRPAAVYCVRGPEASQGTAAALRGRG